MIRQERIFQHSSIGLALPHNIYLMTFEPWKDSSFLIRFEHILEKNEDPVLSSPTRFNLSDVFPGFEVDLQELTLSANQWIEDDHRLHFNEDTLVDFVDDFGNKTAKKTALTDSGITLNPMEIKTFIMVLSPKV